LKDIYIPATQFTSSTKSLDIFVSGCKPPHCIGCHNSELFEFGQGRILDEIYIQEIIDKINEFDSLIKNVFFYGGEPLDQPIDKLIIFILLIKQKCNVNIYLFTKYDLTEVPDIIKKYCDYIKCGRYLREFESDNYKQYNIQLATTNQIIYKKGKDF
jgi:anaerobic ribonucleoside-triphosphate reductase activating protein